MKFIGNGRHPAVAIATKTQLLVMLLIVLSAVSSLAQANAYAIAFGSDKSWGWGAYNTQQEANSTALKICNSYNPKKDCALQVTKALVFAKDKGKTAFGISFTSLADAKKKALSACGTPGCKVSEVVTQPGFYAVVEGGKEAHHLAYEYADSGQANKAALKACELAGNTKCKLILSGAISGTYRTAPVTRRAQSVSEQSCRPTTPTIRCSSQCANGECMITYENGCRIRVQVQPRFDGFTNQWTHPAPSC